MLRHVIIAGANPEGRELGQMLRTEQGLGYHVIGFVDDGQFDDDPVPGIPLLGPIADTGRILREQEGSSVIVASSGVDSEVTNRLARDLLDQGVHVELSSTLARHLLAAAHGAAARPVPDRATSSRCVRVRLAGCGEAGVRHRRRRRWRSSCSRPSCWPRPSPSSSTPRAPIFFSQVRVGRDGQAVPRSSSCAPWSSTPRSSWPTLLDEERGRRAALQDAARPADHPGRSRPAQAVDRRAAPAVERRPGRHEPRRSSAGAAARDRGVGLAAHPAPAGQAGHHRHVAGAAAAATPRSTTTPASTSTTSTTGRSPRTWRSCSRPSRSVALRRGAA